MKRAHKLTSNLKSKFSTVLVLGNSVTIILLLALNMSLNCLPEHIFTENETLSDINKTWKNAIRLSEAMDESQYFF